MSGCENINAQSDETCLRQTANTAAPSKLPEKPWTHRQSCEKVEIAVTATPWVMSEEQHTHSMNLWLTFCWPTVWISLLRDSQNDQSLTELITWWVQIHWDHRQKHVRGFSYRCPQDHKSFPAIEEAPAGHISRSETLPCQLHPPDHEGRLSFYMVSG